MPRSKYYFCAEGNVYGRPAVIARTGYTGEDGFELFVFGEHAPEIWSRLAARQASDGLEPCGLGARDVLRLEAGMPLYGHELTEEITPCRPACSGRSKRTSRSSSDATRLIEQMERDDYPRIAGLIMKGRAPAREGYAVYLRREGRSARSAAVRWRRRSAARTSRPRCSQGSCNRRRDRSRSIFAARGTKRPSCLYRFINVQNRREISVAQPGESAVQQRARMGEDRRRYARRSALRTTRRTRLATSSTSSCRASARQIEQFGNIGVVESVKAVSDLFTPVGGEVLEVNGALEADPAAVNRDPYGAGWLFKVKLKDAGEKSNLLSAQ